MNLKAKESAKHRGYQFIEGVVYDIHSNDAPYFLNTKWLEKTKEKAKVKVPELGFDPETVMIDTGKKAMP